eukprot:CAMPEP_0198275878 /NCGR_PEP_ID=MMETSP1447-20131203/65014_1 /TAXON_ID=420782 /ORGANISM="Chaetoceros dichaeta, Strain CCMP1751" /LENGTH=502 /DNA_ID=CAMNT_0043970785 /DNA_START=461 /DNA_END=1969 /DNA_ORIENTATION=-
MTTKPVVRLLPRSTGFLATVLLILSLSLTSCDARSAFVPKKSSLVPSKSGLANVKNTNLAISSSSITDVATSSRELLSKVNNGGADSSKSSLSTAVFNLVKGIVGVGVLSLPAGVAAFGDAKSAILPAILLITIAGALSGYNFSLMGRICALTSATSYATAWQATIGASTSWIPAITVTLMTFSAVLAYSMVLAETFVGIAGMVGLGDLLGRTRILIGLTGSTLLPLCLMKDLKSLAPFSLLGIVGMLLTVGSMGVRYFDGSYKFPDGKFLSQVADNLKPAFGTAGASAVVSPKAFVLLGMLSTAYMAHFNAPKFYTELEDNTIARYNKLVITSFGISIAIFCMATALGFGTFGKACTGFVLSNYASKDSLIGLSRIAVAFSLIFTYPLVFVGCRDGVMDVLHIPSEKRTNAYLNKVTFAILGAITAVAMVLDDVSFVLSFGGATLGNALIYVIPALMFRKMVQDMGEKASSSLQKEVYFTNFSCVIGVVMGVIGTQMALKQ